MDLIQDKSYAQQRALLFGLLVNCTFLEGAKANCPLSELRSNLSTDKKYEYVMGLSEEEVNSILLQHKKCYEERLSGSAQE
ncbi:hypothetical protein ACFLYW_01560 [Thermodesulfobacteriota bacterium]